MYSLQKIKTMTSLKNVMNNNNAENLYKFYNSKKLSYQIIDIPKLNERNLYNKKNSRNSFRSNFYLDVTKEGLLESYVISLLNFVKGEPHPFSLLKNQQVIGNRKRPDFSTDLNVIGRRQTKEVRKFLGVDKALNFNILELKVQHIDSSSLISELLHKGLIFDRPTGNERNASTKEIANFAIHNPLKFNNESESIIEKDYNQFRERYRKSKRYLDNMKIACTKRKGNLKKLNFTMVGRTISLEALYLTQQFNEEIESIGGVELEISLLNISCFIQLILEIVSRDSSKVEAICSYLESIRVCENIVETLKESGNAIIYPK